MADESTHNSGTSRGVKIALAVSLAVNLLVVGLAVGVYSQVQRGGSSVKFSDAGGAYTRALSSEDRRRIGRQLGERFRPGNNDRLPSRQEYERMISILSSEPFDRAAAEQVLKAQAQTALDRRDVTEQLLLDRLEAMSVEERISFADRLTENLKRPGKGPGRP